MKKASFIFFFLFLSVLLFLNYSSALAQYDYTPMEEIPGPFPETMDFWVYMGYIYRFALGFVGIAAVFMIAIGGYMYTVSAGNNAKMEQAKSVIGDAIIGLLIALLSWIILHEINPDLVNITSGNKIDLTQTSHPDYAYPGGGGTPTSSTGGTDIGVRTSAPETGSGNCYGLQTRPGISDQCTKGEVSQSAQKFAACLSDKGNYVVSSFSDSDYGLSCGCGNWHPDCAHSEGSYHYCQDGSHAIDFSFRGPQPSAQAIQECRDETGLQATEAANHGNHWHMSVDQSSCACRRL